MEEFELNGIDIATMKKIMGVDPEAEQYGCDVPPELVQTLAEYIDSPFTVNSLCDYQIDFYRR